MRGLSAIEYLKRQADYAITETPEYYAISFREHGPARIPKQAVEQGMTLKHICKLANAGWNCKHITRVTGYFSYTEGWNKGKVQELNDRNRTPIT